MLLRIHSVIGLLMMMLMMLLLFTLTIGSRQNKDEIDSLESVIRRVVVMMMLLLEGTFRVLYPVATGIWNHDCRAETLAHSHASRSAAKKFLIFASALSCPVVVVVVVALIDLSLE